MSYHYDVFLSYRRIELWPKFVNKHFLPMLTHWLHTELGKKPRIYFDVNDIETGASWPHVLANAVATSKVMICLWSREYLSSDWCKAEFGLMLARRKATSGPNDPLPLILTVIIHDGDDFPEEFSDIQQLSIRDYASPHIGEDSPTKELLDKEIKKLAEHVYNAIQRVPDYDPGWRNLAIDEFVRTFKSNLRQSRPPSLGINKE